MEEVDCNNSNIQRTVDPLAWNDDASTSSMNMSTIVTEPTSLATQHNMEYDFSGANTLCQWPPIMNATHTKTFLIHRKGDEMTQAIRFAAEETGSIFSLISAMFKIPEKKLIVTYPLKTTSGEKKIITLKHSVNLAACLEIFYCQADPMVSLQVKQIQGDVVRKKRPGETNYSEFQKRRTIDKRSYEAVQKDHYIGSEFLEKLDFVRVLLGAKKCLNLLNPSLFLCPMKTCKKIINLKYYNNMSLIVEHFKNIHALEENEDGRLGKLLLQRYYFLSKNDWMSKNKHLTVGEKVKELEQLRDEENSLSIIDFEARMHLPKRGMNYVGKDLLMKKEIVEKILNYDDSALDGISEPTDIRQWFGN